MGGISMNADIKTFKAYIAQEFLYDMDPSKIGSHLPCVVFGVSTYINETLTFNILLQDGSMFQYIPFHALRLNDKETDFPSLELRDLVYHNCRNLEIDCHTFDHLKGTVNCHFRYKDIWIPGEYFTTIDFYKGNDTLHIIKLENGQLTALPTSRVKFKDGIKEFPPYKKLHPIWRV
jgi:hypothetical protein